MISLDELGVRISDLIEQYATEVKAEAIETLDETANEILDYIMQNCPRAETGDKHLADSFVKTEVGEGLNKTIYISSESKGRLVHLIELGFKHRSGTHVPARPFMRPAYDAFAPEMIEAIKKIISGGNI